MVLGKVYRLSIKREDGKASFLLEHRTDREQSLLFEAGAVVALSAREVDAVKSMYKPHIDAYGCLGVLQLTTDTMEHLLFLVLVTGCVSIGKLADSEIFRITDTGFISLRGHLPDGDRIKEIRMVLNAGTFYFSWTPKADTKPFDITICAQRETRNPETDNRFFWNRTLHLHFTRFGIDTDQWLIKTMCGGISISTIYVGAKQAKACLFSRLSCERAGTRFNVRGVNDEGSVANFVETEQVIYMDSDTVTSYVLIRGSIPIFWEQPGVNVGSHKIKLSRGPEVSQPAYDRHVALVRKRYGNQHFITLCGSKEGEANVTKMYKGHHHASAITKEIPLTDFDYHHYCSRGKLEKLTTKLKVDIKRHLTEFGFFTKENHTITSSQSGTFRVNCVDCLDRTNCVQTFIGLEVLEFQLESIKQNEKSTISSRFHEAFKSMWVVNGDQISRIYAGTGALEGKNKLKDSTLSVARTIQNNLLDSGKQEAMDILLMGKELTHIYADRARSLLTSNFLHLPPNILESLCDRHLDYSTVKKVKVKVGTWNVNGGKHFNSIVYKRSDPLSDWLLDAKPISPSVPNLMDLSLNDASLEDMVDGPTDIFAIGFEEIVDLNATNIVNASSANQMEWMGELKSTISRDEPYVLVTSVQLVGVCLFLFVRPQHAKFIKDVAVDQVKTGLGGATGNKGGVAIRFRFYSTSMAFLCSHFAAGQHQVTERNSDFHEIMKKIAFPMGRNLFSHDFIYWCGDFNYRIDMDNDYVKDLVSQKDWGTLLAADQLTLQRKDGKVFEGFLEPDIRFAPTYKYDINSDVFDTSEKARCPAYTDRILFKKNFQTHKQEDLNDKRNYGNVLNYNRAELKTSDHRPVVFEVIVDALIVNETLRDAVFQEVIEKMGPPDATVLVTDASNGLDGITDAVSTEVQNALSSKFGEVILARFGDDSFQLIFKDGKAALAAANSKEFTSNTGVKLLLRLKTPDWVPLMMAELKLGDNNTIPLADDFEIETALANAHIPTHFDTLLIGQEFDELSIGGISGRNSPANISQDGSEGSAKGPNRPPPPSPTPHRPPPPNRPATSVPEGEKPKPSRPAPPPPAKAVPPPFQKQEKLNPPSIIQTCPSTESSFESDQPNATPSSNVGPKKPPPPSTPAPPPPLPPAPVPPQDPQDVWGESKSSGDDFFASDPFSSSNNQNGNSNSPFDDSWANFGQPAESNAGPLPPPPPPLPVSAIIVPDGAVDDGDSDCEALSSPPPMVPPPPPPVPDHPPPPRPSSQGPNPIRPPLPSRPVVPSAPK